MRDRIVGVKPVYKKNSMMESSRKQNEYLQIHCEYPLGIPQSMNTTAGTGVGVGSGKCHDKSISLGPKKNFNFTEDATSCNSPGPGAWSEKGHSKSTKVTQSPKGGYKVKELSSAFSDRDTVDQAWQNKDSGLKRNGDDGSGY
jgi:hypothetical protein